MGVLPVIIHFCLGFSMNERNGKGFFITHFGDIPSYHLFFEGDFP